MFPALKSILFALLVCTLTCGFADSCGNVLAQSTTGFTSVAYSLSRSTSSKPQDAVENELALYGKRGQLIAEARARTLSILSSDNSCSSWFRQAEPQPDEFFRTLRFIVDASGRSEILKVERARGDVEYFHPYTAHAGQNVGPGSTITLNANGAFFKDHAIVRVTNAPADLSRANHIRPLTVADILGDTDQARILTLLHEFGHVTDLLPLDSGTPSAAFLSVQNTQTVMRNCKSEIESAAKLSKAATRILSVGYAALAAPQSRSNSLKRQLPAYSPFWPRP